MNRTLTLLVAVLLVAAPAMSFDTTRRGANRIAVLDAPAYDNGGYGDRMSVRVREQLVPELRVSDGRTLDLVARRRLDRSNTTVIPTGVGAGSSRLSVFLAVPFVEYLRGRAAVNAVVDDAADEIDGLGR